MAWIPPAPPPWMLTTTIIVNGRPKYVTERMLTRDDVLRLAGYDWRMTDVLVDEMVVTHRQHWANSDERELLKPWEALQVVEGMIIDVYCPPDERNDYSRS